MNELFRGHCASWRIATETVQVHHGIIVTFHYCPFFAVRRDDSCESERLAANVPEPCGSVKACAEKARKPGCLKTE
jgi:hypothetical protein